MKDKLYQIVLAALFTVMPLLSLHAQIGTPISSYNDLNTLVRLDLAGVYYLTKDIEIPEGTEWLPLGKPSNWNGNSGTLANFTGLLDGRGFAIKNLKITTGDNFSGLFARIVNGDIKNLRLENVDIRGGSPTGALAGSMFGGIKTYETSVNIDNVSVTGSIKGTTEVGGIVGRDNDNPENIIANCYVNANVEATAASGAYAGGIVGCMNTGQRLTIKNVYVAGSVKATNYAAGVLGYIASGSNNANTKFVLDASVVAAEISGGTGSELLYNKGSLTLGTATLTNNSACNNELTSPDATLVDLATLQTQAFYEGLGWDFEKIWTIENGNFPTLLLDVEDPDPSLKYQIYGLKALDGLMDRFHNTGTGNGGDLFCENLAATDSVSGLYVTKGNNGGASSAWPCAHLFRTLTWAALIEPKYKTELQTLLTNIDKYRNNTKLVPPGNVGGYGCTITNGQRFFDDNAVLSYGIMLAYERVIREQSVLDKCLYATNYDLKFRDEHWGLPQTEPNLGEERFNLGSVLPMTSTYAMLYGISGNPDDLYIATNYYEILTKGIPQFRNANGLYFGGGQFNAAGVFVPNGGTRDANTCGVAVLGVRLYVVTHDVRYLNEAKAMTDIVLAKDYKKGAGFNEVSYWGGNAVIDLLCELYEQDPDPKWYNAAKDIVDFLIDKSRDKRGFYPSGDKGNWNRVGTNIYPPKTINTISQACAAHAILRFAYLDATYGAPTSIPYINNQEANKPLVYPNPVRDILHIKNADQNAQVEIFALSGVKVIQGKGDKIDVSSIPSGVYVVRINMGKAVYMLKVVKE